MRQETFDNHLYGQKDVLEAVVLLQKIMNPRHQNCILITQRWFLIFKKVWQRSFISTVRSTVHTNHSRNETFENAPQAGGIWKRRLFIFVWTENILKTEPFENDDHTVMVLFFFSEFFSNTNPKTFARKYRTIPISSPWVSEDDPKMTGDLKISPV